MTRLKKGDIINAETDTDDPQECVALITRDRGEGNGYTAIVVRGALLGTKTVLDDTTTEGTLFYELVLQKKGKR